MELYFWNQGNQEFELKSIPEWSNYEPMVETAKTALDLLSKDQGYETVMGIVKAFKAVDSGYDYDGMVKWEVPSIDPKEMYGWIEEYFG